MAGQGGALALQLVALPPRSQVGPQARQVLEPGAATLSGLRFRHRCGQEKGSSGWAKRKHSSAITRPPPGLWRG